MRAGYDVFCDTGRLSRFSFLPATRQLGDIRRDPPRLVLGE
jgi:hypothetical protein